jgi:branched-chain amino acid transport system permease protein
MEYVLHVVIICAIYGTLAASLDLVAGQAGLMSVAHAGFFGVGAYTSALLSLQVGGLYVLWLIGAMVAACLASLLVSIPSLRLYDDYFVIATFGFQMILFSIFNNWMDMTQGPLGISAIPAPTIIPGVVVDTRARFAALAILIAVLAAIAVNRLASSAFGRVLRSIRENESFARSFGKNTFRFKVYAFAISAALAGAAGSLYAHYYRFIDPTSFSVTESILVIAMVIIGGAASRWGPIIGAGLLVVLPEGLRLVGLPNSVAAGLRQVVYGTLLALLMAVRPRGLVGQYDLGR